MFNLVIFQGTSDQNASVFNFTQTSTRDSDYANHMTAALGAYLSRTYRVGSAGRQQIFSKK